MIKNYLNLLRVEQWIKNLFLFVPLIFSKNLFSHSHLLLAFTGFAAFSLASSVVYILNDIIDINSDKLHPVKKFRPLASGTLSIFSAKITASLLVVITAIISIALPVEFAITIIAYLILNIFYSYILKHVVLLDIFSIALGFMLRVIAGALIIDVYLSSWLILTTMFISLFLAVSKRYSELKLAETLNGVTARKVLANYSLEFTRDISLIAASAVIICYALYSVSERTISIFHTENLIYTTPFVVYGIFRYMYLVTINQKGENTAELLVKDVPLIINIILYIIAAVLIIYNVL